MSKELEFQQSNKDLKALKHVLDAIREKGLLETKNSKDKHYEVSICKNYSNQIPTRNEQNFISIDDRNPHNTPSVPTLIKGSNTPRTFDSSIVIMKPAKSISKSSVSASSVIPLESLSGFRKLQACDSMHRKKTSTNNRMAKDQTPKASTMELAYQPLLSIDKKSTNRIEEISIQKTHIQAEQCSYMHQQSPRENNGSLVKTSSSLSPRLQQRKIETDKRSRMPVASSKSNKPRRNSANRQTLKSFSPRHRVPI